MKLRSKTISILFAAVACLLSSLSAVAAEAYAVYTESNTTLTFYYDNMRSSRSGTKYDLNTGNNNPEWNNDFTCAYVTHVVFHSSFAGARPTSTRSWFADMSNIQSISGTQYLNTSEVTNMVGMFSYSGGNGMTSLNLSFLNTSKVTNMGSMFFNCHFTSINVSGWNTANVQNMSYMFAFCYFLKNLELSGWNTAKVTDMREMFNECHDLESINMSGWNTANVTNMSCMFRECNALKNIDVSEFNTAKVTDMYSMFSYCNNLTKLDISKFNTAKVTDMEEMFYDCNKLTTIYVGSEWTTTAVTSSNDMFKYCTKIKGGKGTTYNTSHVDKAYAHIDGGTSNPGYLSSSEREAYVEFTSSDSTLTFYYDNLRSIRPGTIYDMNSGISLPEWHKELSKTTHVVFHSSFAGARPTTTHYWFGNFVLIKSIAGLKYLNTSQVTDMAFMFLDCGSLTELDLSNFDTSQVTDMEGMFDYSYRLTSLDLSSFNTANVTNMSRMFWYCSGLTSINLSSFNTANVTRMDEMFENCSGLTSLDLSNFNTANVTNMGCMFLGCSGLTSINLNSFTTNNVTDMGCMFKGCSGLTTLELGSFNTAKVSKMLEMFNNCGNLTTIYVDDKWSTTAVSYANSRNMFYGCSKIKGGQGTTYNPYRVDKGYARIDGGPSAPGYFTAASTTLRGDVNGDGEVTIADVNTLINMILSNDADSVGDVNGDQEITIADINDLINIILNN